MRKKIGGILVRLGIRPGLKGFKYLIDSVEILNADENILLTKVYCNIAEKYGTSYRSIERSIRYSLSKINTSSKEYQRYIGAYLPHSGVKVSASAFIHTLAFVLEEMEEN